MDVTMMWWGYPVPEWLALAVLLGPYVIGLFWLADKLVKGVSWAARLAMKHCT